MKRFGFNGDDAAAIAGPSPEARSTDVVPFTQAASYGESLDLWRGAEDVNAWIGARFQYDMARAMLLSETQRQKKSSRCRRQ